MAECGCVSQSDESTDDDGVVQDKSQLTINTMDATDDDATDVIVSINIITTVRTINTADTPELEGAISSPVRHQRPHLFFCTLTAVAIGGMGVVSFGVLATSTNFTRYCFLYRRSGCSSYGTSAPRPPE